jgi:hypothetical protein
MLKIPDSGSFQAQPQTPEDIAIETIFRNTWQYSNTNAKAAGVLKILQARHLPRSDKYPVCAQEEAEFQQARKQ